MTFVQVPFKPFPPFYFELKEFLQTSPPVWTLDDMVRDLQAWFDLKIHDDITSCEQDSEKENQERVPLQSALGLEHFLLIWEQLLLNNIVACDDLHPHQAHRRHNPWWLWHVPRWIPAFTRDKGTYPTYLLL